MAYNPTNVSGTAFNTNVINTAGNRGPYGKIISKTSWDTQLTVRQTSEERPPLSLALARAGQNLTFVVGRTRVPNVVPIWYGNIKNIIETEVSEKTDTRVRQANSFGMFDIITDDYSDVIKPKTQIPEDSDLLNIPDRNGLEIGGGGAGSGTPTKAVTTGVTETITVKTYTDRVVGYSLDAALGICLGPGVELLSIYSGDIRVWNGNTGIGRTEIPGNGVPDNVLQNGAIFHSGEYGQAPDPYLAAFIPATHHIGYTGVAYIIFKGVNATAIQNATLSFEVRRMPNPLALPSGNAIASDDLNAASAAVEFLVNEWGMIGVSNDWIDVPAFVAAAELFANEGIGVSYAIAQGSSGTRLLQDIQYAVNSIITVDEATGLITIRPIRNTVPDSDTSVKLNPRNVSAIQKMSKPSFVGMITHFGVTYYDRDNNYEGKTVVSINPAVPPMNNRSQKINGIDLAGVCTASIANSAFNVIMPAVSMPLLSFTLVADRAAGELKLGDVFFLTWPLYNLVDYPVRVTKLREQDVKSNYIVLECIQHTKPTIDDFFQPPLPTDNDGQDMTQKPPLEVRAISVPWQLLINLGYDGNPNDQVIYTYPIFLVAGANNHQLAFTVTDVENNVEILTAKSNAHAQLVEEMPKLAGRVTNIIPHVTLKNVVNADYFVDIEPEDIRTGQRLLYVDNEWLSYETVTTNNDGTITLNNVHRGLVESVPALHAADARVFMITSTVNGFTDKPHIYDGNPFQYAVHSHGRTSSGTYPADAVAVEYNSYRDADAPLRPHNIVINSERTELPINVYVGTKVVTEWKVRSRKNRKILLASDFGDRPEIMSFDRRQNHIVSITDSDDNEIDVASSLVGDVDNNYDTPLTDYDDYFVTFNVPVTATTGPGVLRVYSTHAEYVAADAAADPDYWPNPINYANSTEEIEIYINPVEPFEIIMYFDYEVE